MLTLELAVEQNTQLVERLDRSMQELKLSFAELRQHVDQKFAEFRLEMIRDRIELRQEMDAKYEQTRQEMDAKYEKTRLEMDAKYEKTRQEMDAKYDQSRKEFVANQAEFLKMVERRFFWNIAIHYGALLSVVGYLGKHFIDVYYK